MTAAQVAALTAAAAVLVLVHGARPGAVVTRLGGPAAGAAGATGVGGHGPAVAAGRVVRRWRRRPPDPAAERRVGRVVITAALLAVVEPLLAMLWCVVCVAVAVGRGRSRADAERRGLVEELPEVVDLLNLATASGLTVPLALRVVGDRGAGRIAAALGRAVVLSSQGEALPESLEGLVPELGEEVRPLVRVLCGSLRDGTSVGPSLERLAGEVRTERRRAAEERARRLPVRLLFPLVTCVLPAFALLTVVPLLAGALSGLPR